MNDLTRGAKGAVATVTAVARMSSSVLLTSISRYPPLQGLASSAALAIEDTEDPRHGRHAGCMLLVSRRSAAWPELGSPGSDGVGPTW
jgi:hypothetical protein